MFEVVQQRAATLARDGLKVRRLVSSCRKLLSERGEAAGVSQARITLDLYRELDRKEQARFFLALRHEFSPDPAQVLAAAQSYVDDPSAAHLARLAVVAEPPRQELLRRLNRGRVTDEQLCFSYGIGYGDMLDLEEDLFGLEVNLASKLGEDLAKPGEALLTPTAAAALSPALLRRVVPYRIVTFGNVSLPVQQLKLRR